MNLSIKINNIDFKNPVLPASGTFGFGREISEYYDLSVLGGIVSKGVTRFPRDGNPPARIAETDSGMINSVGLQNMGIENFIKHEIDNFTSYDCASIVNIAGSTIEEYVEMTQMLNNTNCDLIELNLSCPNVKEGCMAFGATYEGVYKTVSKVMEIARKPVWVKLTPNVSDIRGPAKAAQEAGASAISLINTVLGLAIDVNTKKPVLKNNYGGLSGPAIKPIALRMVNEVYSVVKIPIIGMGGIMSAKDVLEFIMCGASLVQIGTGNLINPFACKDIINDLEFEMKKINESDIRNLVGCLSLW